MSEESPCLLQCSLLFCGVFRLQQQSGQHMQTGAAAVLLQNLFWAAHCSALLHTLHLGPRHKIHWADVTKISEFWPDRSRGDGAACVLQCCSGCKLSSARLASQLAGLQSAAAAVVLQSRCSPAHMQPAACSSPGPGTRPNCTNAAENVQCPQCRARGSAGWRGRAAASQTLPCVTVLWRPQEHP